MSRKIIVLLCALIAAGCLCASGYADDFYADRDKTHAYSQISGDTNIQDINVTKKGGPSGSVGSEYEYRGVNSAVFLSNDAAVTFYNMILLSNARYSQGVFLLGSEKNATTAKADIKSSDITTYADHSDGVYNSNGSLTISTSEIAAGRLGTASYSPAVTTYGSSANTVLKDVSAWTSGDNSPVLKVYGTGSQSSSTTHLVVQTPSTGSSNEFFSYGQNSPVLYSTGRAEIYSSIMNADCSAGVVVDGDGQVVIDGSSMDLGHTYAPTAKVLEHPAVQIGDTISGNAGFSMTDGHIAADRGDIFLVKGTNASITLSGVNITNNDGSANLLKAESSAKNNSTVTFSVSNQSITGIITAESGSVISADFYGNTTFSGAVNKGGNVDVTMQKDNNASPTWYLTANSYVSSLKNQGTIIAGPYKLYVNGSLYSPDMAAETGAFYADYRMTGNSKAITITTTAIPSGKTSSQYSACIDAESESPISWNIADGSLPEGLSLGEDGKISGTPETPGTYIFVVEAFNDSHITARQYTLVITDGSASFIKIETTSLNDASTYSAYSAALAASGAGTITWSIEEGFALPDGLSLDSTTGIISGTPSKTGTYTFMVRASAVSSVYFDTKLLTLRVVEGSDVFVITTDKLKDATVGKTYSAALKAKGSGSLTWTAEYLPEGLSISSSGKISGKAVESGTFNPSFTVTNGTESATSTLAIIVKDVKPKIKASIKAGLIDTAYTAVFIDTAGTGETTWELSGDLPNGLTFNEQNATISGKPTEGWNGNIIVTASNSGGTTSKKCKLQIKAIKPQFTINKPPAATFGEPYETQVELTGSQPIVLEVKGLPEGLSYDYDSFDEVVKIYGTPTKGGNFSVKMTASNIQGKSSKSAKIVVDFPPAFKDTILSDAYTGKSYSAKIPVDGTKKITWSIASGELPNGLELNSKSGQIKGKPTTGGTFSFTVEASNSYGSAVKSFDLVVKVTPPKISTSSLKKAKYEKAYSMKIKVKDGIPDAWDIDGQLPAGITFADGVFSGTPEEAFTGSVTVTVENEGGRDSKTYILQVAAEAPKITTPSLASGTVGKSYSASLEATGTPEIIWRWSGYPAGLTLDKDTGRISGTPSRAGTFNVTVTAENDAKRVSKKYKIEIAEAENDSAVQNVRELPEGPEIFGEDSELKDDVMPEELPEGFVIAAELGEVSVDVSGMYDFDAELNEPVQAGAKMYWIANSEMPSDDDAIAEFFSEDGQEIEAVPESRKVSVSVWLNAGVIYRPVIAVKQ